MGRIQWMEECCEVLWSGADDEMGKLWDAREPEREAGDGELSVTTLAAMLQQR
jgi:hypothetical protein